MSDPAFIERLAGHHDRSQFDCGNEPLNDWLRLRSGQYVRRDLAVIYALARQAEHKVLGYYSLSCHSINADLFPEDQARRLPKIAIPVALLGRFAIDKNEQGKGFGRKLLLAAIGNCIQISAQIGCLAIEVDALDNSARDFYTKFGFAPFLDDSLHLYMTMTFARKHYLYLAP